MLAHIEAGALLPPLVVLQTLAKNPQLKLSVVKDYAARTLSAEGAAVEEDRKAIARFQEETASMRAEITELKTKVRQLQPHLLVSMLHLQGFLGLPACSSLSGAHLADAFLLCRCEKWGYTAAVWGATSQNYPAAAFDLASTMMPDCRRGGLTRGPDAYTLIRVLVPWHHKCCCAGAGVPEQQVVL